MRLTIITASGQRRSFTFARAATFVRAVNAVRKSKIVDENACSATCPERLWPCGGCGR